MTTPGRTMTSAQAGDLLRRLFATAVGAAQPALAIPPLLPALSLPRQGGRLVVVGAGKASAAMAKAVEDHWDGPLSGLVITRYGYAEPCQRIEIVEAAHPVPDQAGLEATQRLFRLAEGLSEQDTVLCLISGGGSALLAAPLPGLTLADKQQVNQALLTSGATISEMNVVRRHLSAVKGGRLAAAFHPARVVTLVLSDVPGDNPVDIASGPTVGDPTTCADALAIVRRYGLDLPAAALDILTSGAGESVKPDDPRLQRAEIHLIATPLMALEAAAAVGREAGFAVHILGDALEGEARDVGKVMAGLARHVARHQQPFTAPCILLSGGETTVTVRGNGRGGRNVEFLLSLAITLAGEAGVYGLAADTDGVDGREEVAGAVITPDTLDRALAAGVRPLEALDTNDAHSFFAAIGDQVTTGPTRTNVNDFRAILVV
ncbi:glycerate kinase type-2 family protein [Insolitispirillum peregrinum]|uniref:Glycerate 2-kinase n=1 Tax=Insolitispirillum peregrinum TaxID=80876 RepID=A0A1N7NLS0_9PROT|nr:glycerate kinase [Insolitispirillum peregrinum]SIS99237.1 glycerate 2-kinase [Insolitispirillum peregrinum]